MPHSAFARREFVRDWTRLAPFRNGTKLSGNARVETRELGGGTTATRVYVYLFWIVLTVRNAYAGKN